MATSKAEEYRTKAREAEQLAERTNNSVIKEQALSAKGSATEGGVTPSRVRKVGNLAAIEPENVQPKRR